MPTLDPITNIHANSVGPFTHVAIRDAISHGIPDGVPCTFSIQVTAPIPYLENKEVKKESEALEIANVLITLGELSATPGLVNLTTFVYYDSRGRPHLLEFS